MNNHGNADRLGDFLVVLEKHSIRIAVERRDENRIGDQTFGILRLLYRAGYTQRAHTRPDRHQALAARHRGFYHPAPLKTRQFMSLAQKSQNSQPVDPDIKLEIDQPDKAVRIELSRMRER